MTETESLISLEEAAARLKVSHAYVRELVRKKRLAWAGENLLWAQEVAQLAALMNKLRAQGIATLVDIAATDIKNK